MIDKTEFRKCIEQSEKVVTFYVIHVKFKLIFTTMSRDYRRTDSVVVFKEEDIDESIVLSLCDKCESIRIVDSNFFIERKKNNKGEENSAISSKLKTSTEKKQGKLLSL